MATLNFFTRWLAQREPVHIATTPAEREAVYRFRYAIYVNELSRLHGEPDHERQMLHDADDEADFTTILYTGTPEAVTSTMRLRHWRAGAVPRKDFESFAMHRIPDIEKLNTAEQGRLMIRRDKRGQLLLVALSLFSYRYLVESLQTDLGFLTAAPGLVHHYRILGFRPYGGTLIQGADGLSVPLMNICSDYAFYRRIDSFLAPLVYKIFRDRKRVLDIARYTQLLEAGHDVVRIEGSDVLQELLAAVTGSPANGVLSTLSDPAIRTLVKYGYILNVPGGLLISRKGYGEDALYFVLDGQCQIAVDGQEIRRVGKGSLLGEMAFFLPDAKRTADITALQASRLLVLRGSALRRLLDKDPRAATELLLLAGRTMAEKLQATSYLGAE